MTLSKTSPKIIKKTHSKEKDLTKKYKNQKGRPDLNPPGGLTAGWPPVRPACAVRPQFSRRSDRPSGQNSEILKFQISKGNFRNQISVKP